MRRTWLLLLIGALSNVAYASEYYRWVDENGTVHFSDARPEISIEMTFDVDILTQPNSGNVAAPSSPATPPIPPIPEAPALATRVTLLSPTNDATIRNNQGMINIELSTDLPLGKNQKVRALVDGKSQPSQQSLQLALDNLDRGSHTIKVQLLQDGKVIATTSSVTVFLHRAIQRKAPPKGKPTPR
ncbi:hypothetical protein A1OQ_08730 [Enterovibrio norvegicus FF-162]|uniref:DUF4124 domain-containing protein n=1 Tax=Enterovibrio norvegicus FF-454 TaxID=1185651 RepID=A0A1E5CDC1_9GAMM|nr:DUF4124 domain-containing protein [Enterovibrio norvegicus]OEE63510.1 hypothetical protein A1OK_06555 [Enterovibrio norvegicus FF-454]OEE74680.1 hypothetical protein A1OQ_08730 [Enterovibrio norvegicus FF-162]